MTTLFSRAAGLLLIAGLAGSASAFDITEVSSSDDTVVDKTVSAAVGSVLTIDGTAFGTAKPKVFLTDGEGKKYNLKVEKDGFSDTQITATIKKAIAGDLTLNVQPKGADEPFTFVAVTIEVPQITGILDHETLEEITEASPGMEMVFSGTFFGTKKGKVFIGGKKCKVKEWLGDEVHLLMTKALANGLWDILLDNKVGTDEDEQITMIESTKKVGKVTLEVTVGEGAFAQTIKYKYKENPSTDPEYLAFGGSTGDFPIKVTGLVVHFNPATDPVPVDISSGDKGNEGMVCSFSIALKGPSKFVPGDFASWLIIPGAEGFVVHMTSSGGGQAGGTFEADLPLITPANGASAVFGDANPLHIEGTFVCQQAAD